LVSIEVVTLRHAGPRLVPGWMTVFGCINHLGADRHPGLLSRNHPAVAMAQWGIRGHEVWAGVWLRTR